MLFGDNGLISKTKNTSEKYKEKEVNEEEYMNILTDEIDDINLGLNIKVKLNGKIIKLTKDNFAEYLGMEVTNFKESGTGIEEVDIIGAQVEEANGKVKVSTKYRLYYIDFDNKFGDGKGTIYLKADCTNNNYKLSLDNTGADEKLVNGSTKTKIKQLNPSLYAKGKITPASTNGNMQAVTWLLNEEKWAGLKNNLKEGVEEKLNYIVGAPSLEMMIDSYNTHYGLTGDAPVLGNIQEGESRKKLFYKYEGKEGEYGYKVGPGYNSEYDEGTASRTIMGDSKIDEAYYPGESHQYWLSSPSANNGYDVRVVVYTQNGYLYRLNYLGTEDKYRCAFCPLASLKSSFKLELKENIT